jgi:uncharacterized coiled-coil DUF342 family protein
MEEPGLHPGLEIGMTVLATRIAELRHKAGQASHEPIEDLGEIDELERRYKALEDELGRLNRAGPGLRQDMKAGLETVADDLLDWVEEHVKWIDSGYQPDQRPKRPHKS